MRVKMKIPLEAKARYNSLMLQGKDMFVPEICDFISWRGKVIKKNSNSRKCFEVDFTPSERLSDMLDHMYEGLETIKHLGGLKR